MRLVGRFRIDTMTERKIQMARALILWLMGVPLFIVLLLWYFFF